MSQWKRCQFCINQYPTNQFFEGKCPECQAEHLKAIALDNHNTRQLRQLAQPQTPATTQEKPSMPKITMSRDEAILAAANELANQEGATLTQVLRRAGDLRGKSIGTGYLSPSGSGYSLRPQVEAILGISKPVENAPEAPAAESQAVADLQAEVARLQKELAQARATERRDGGWVAGLRTELAKDHRTLAQIESDRLAVAERIAAAELLLSTVDGEPVERWQLLQGGAAQAEVA